MCLKVRKVKFLWSKQIYFEIFALDDLLHRRKMRQRREREEKKREKAINEINDRQMGRVLSASANIDICSSAQFPEYSEFNELATASNCSPSTSSSSPASRAKSFANVIYIPFACDIL